LSECRKNLIDKNLTVSRNVVEAFGAEAAPKMQQQLLGELGELLVAWPEIRRGAAELCKNGATVGNTISPNRTSTRR
jgi:hypothetical protein